VCALSLCGLGVLAPSARAQTGAQEPIRVESKEVFVPILVLDKRRAGKIRDMDEAPFYGQATGANAHLLTDVAVSGLSAKDFRILDDGSEQKIERVTLEPFYGDDRGAGVGKWVGPDVGPITGVPITPPHWPCYLIVYEQPPSARGSCHQIVVKVDRPNSLIYTRGGYCNLGDSAADPLVGTKIGARMEEYLNAGKEGGIGLSLAAFNSFGKTNQIVTNIVLGFPAKAQRSFDCYDPPDIDVLGIVYAKDGTVAARFSDLENLGVWSFVGETIPALLPQTPTTRCVMVGVPDQYETQLDLAPGNYNLQVIFRDGGKFGTAETRISVAPFDEKQIAVSDVALAATYHQLATEPQHIGAVLPQAYVPLVSKGFEVTPAADTHFRKGKPFYFYFEIYVPQPPGLPAKTIQAHLRILDSKSGKVVKSLEPANAAPYAKDGDPVIPIGGGIDISALPNGSYRLDVQATDSAGNATPWRSVDFTIE